MVLRQAPPPRREHPGAHRPHRIPGVDLPGGTRLGPRHHRRPCARPARALPGRCGRAAHADRQGLHRCRHRHQGPTQGRQPRTRQPGDQPAITARGPRRTGQRTQIQPKRRAHRREGQRGRRERNCMVDEIRGNSLGPVARKCNFRRAVAVLWTVLAHKHRDFAKFSQELFTRHRPIFEPVVQLNDPPSGDSSRPCCHPDRVGADRTTRGEGDQGIRLTPPTARASWDAARSPVLRRRDATWSSCLRQG